MPLNRRGFFSAVSSAFAGTPVTKAVAQPATEEWRRGLPDEFRLPGWKIRWSGWKEPINQAMFCGQWVAVPVDRAGRLDGTRFGVYSSVPGRCAAFLPGECFDTCLRHTQPFPATDLPEDLRELARRNALAFLLDVLRNERHWLKLPRDSWGAPDIRTAWKHYKPATRFQLDPLHFLKERFPGMRGWEDSYGDTFLAERKRLLGF